MHSKAALIRLMKERSAQQHFHSLRGYMKQLERTISWLKLLLLKAHPLSLAVD